MLKKIREWSFPAGVLIAWLAVASYTISQLSRLPFGRTAPIAVAPAETPALPDVPST